MSGATELVLFSDRFPGDNGDVAATLADVAPLDQFSRVVAITGAGISAAAGLGTFRGAGGLWTASPDVELAMQSSALPANLPELWDVWGGIRRRATGAGPTPAHRALQAAGVQIITQNVDGLHQDAGSEGVLELHGSAARTACLDECGYTGPLHATAGTPEGEIPRCPQCDGPLRPDVVLYGEALDHEVWRAAAEAAVESDLFLVIGTSGIVTPANQLAPLARQAGAFVVNVNLDDQVGGFMNPFDAHVIGDCQTTLPSWVEAAVPSPLP